MQRQKDLKLLDADLADKLDLDRVQPFFESGVWRRIRAARKVLREEPFITALPAGQVTPEAGNTDAQVLVQGIADLVLVLMTMPRSAIIRPMPAVTPSSI